MRKMGPIRMCIGCGEREVQRALLRFSLGEDGMLKAGAGRGRSGYLHPRGKCLQAFAKARPGFVRSLRAVVSQDLRAQYIAQLECNPTVLS